MYTYETSISGKASSAKIWELYSDVSKWCLWDKSLKKVTLFGVFQKDTKGVMELLDGQQLPFTLSECIENSSFTTKSEMGPISVVFGHILKENGNHVTITHTVTIEGGNEMQTEGMGKGIAAGIPQCLQQLISLATKNEIF